MRASGLLAIVLLLGCAGTAARPALEPAPRPASKAQPPASPPAANEAAREPPKVKDPEADLRAQDDLARVERAEQEADAFDAREPELASGLSPERYELHAAHVLARMQSLEPNAGDPLRERLRALFERALREHPEHERLALLAYELDVAEPAQAKNARALADRMAALPGTDPHWPQRARAALCAAGVTTQALAARLVRDHVCRKQASQAAAARLLELLRTGPYVEAERVALELCKPAGGR